MTQTEDLLEQLECFMQGDSVPFSDCAKVVRLNGELLRNIFKLKSTVDAEREADSKTIRELAEALINCVENFKETEIRSNGDIRQIQCDTIDKAEKALSDNAPRIAEAQEEEK